MPEIFSRRTPAGDLVFAVPGHDVKSYDYLLKLSRRQAPLTIGSTSRTSTPSARSPALPHPLDFKFEIDRYLAASGRREDHQLGRLGRQREVPRRCVAGRRRRTGSTLKTTLSPGKARSAGAQPDRRGPALQQGDARERHRRCSCIRRTRCRRRRFRARMSARTVSRASRPFLQIPRIVVPAGYNRRRLRAAVRAERGQDRLRLGPRAGHAADAAAAPDADCDHVLRRTRRRADAAQGGVRYEAATKHRVPPPAFGPVAGEP